MGNRSAGAAAGSPRLAFRRTPAALLLTAIFSLLSAWMVAVLVAGRALPWQADRSWALSFVFALGLAAVWWWSLGGKVMAAAQSGRQWILAMLWGANPLLAACVVALLLIYLSDRVNATIEQPGWRQLLALDAGLLGIVTWSMQSAALRWVRGKDGGAREALRSILVRNADAAILGALVLLGVLQAAANVAPVGDDIGHYIAVADALRSGSQYPIDSVAPDLQSAGMQASYPALPGLPVLLAISFALVGRTALGVALPTVIATALFPLVFYLVCRGFTGSRPVSFVAAVLLYLFPIYQIHYLGAPEPDTVFTVLLLVGALLASRADRAGGLVTWLLMGACMGFATLTRPEGILYSAALFLTLFAVHRLKVRLWLSIAAFFATVVPFAALYFSLTGSIWPSTFGGNALSLQNVLGNLATMSWPALPWYGAAIGVGSDGVRVLSVAAYLAAVVGTVLLWTKRPALAGVPIAGLGNIAAVFLVNPRIVAFFNPADGFRHVAIGIPMAALGLACTAMVAVQLAMRLGRPVRIAVFSLAVLAVVGGASVEADRLARPEPYFGGPASLLWTGGGFLLTDILARPVPWPELSDSQSWEGARGDIMGPLEDLNIRKVNRPEPYHWSSLVVVLIGLSYALAPCGTTWLRKREAKGRV
jgi:hypothetical protein